MKTIKQRTAHIELIDRSEVIDKINKLESEALPTRGSFFEDFYYAAWLKGVEDALAVVEDADVKVDEIKKVVVE